MLVKVSAVLVSRTRKRLTSCARVTLPYRAFLYGRPRILFVIARRRYWSLGVLYAHCLGMVKALVVIMALVALQFALFEKLSLGQIRGGSRGGSLQRG